MNCMLFLWMICLLNYKLVKTAPFNNSEWTMEANLTNTDSPYLTVVHNFDSELIIGSTSSVTIIIECNTGYGWINGECRKEYT